MNARIAGQTGMSLVEATIILMVLAVLTATLAPAMGDYVNDARETKAKEDVEVLGTSILRLLRDTGLTCLSDTPSPTKDACLLANRIDLLTSASAVGSNEPVVVSATYSGYGNIGNITDGTSNWAGHADEISDTRRGTVNDHLVTNFASGYANPNFTSGGGPRAGIGWRGAYVNGPTGLDPWGFAYQASTVFLTVSPNATGTSNAEGDKNGGWKADVIVISAGSNSTMQTLFGAEGTSATGDDVVYILKGNTR